MNVVELLEQALAAAAARGFKIRYEWLGGQGGGPCEIRGQAWLFVDLALPTLEQLAQVAQALEPAQVQTAPLARQLEPNPPLFDGKSMSARSKNSAA